MRYYVCDIIGDGLTPETAYRPANADYGEFESAWIPYNPDGSPKSSWCFIRSESNAATAQARKLPSLPPQASSVARNALDTILVGMGITPDSNLPEYAAAVDMINRDFT